MDNTSTTPLFQWISKSNLEAPTALKKNKFIILAILGLVIILSIIAKNYLLVLLLVMFTAVIFLLRRNQPLEENVEISEEGIHLGEKFYAFKSLAEFWIANKASQAQILTLKLKRPVFNEITIHLNNQDPNTVREFLLQRLDENPKIVEESLQDLVLKWLGI